jgi:DNA adenine methylase
MSETTITKPILKWVGGKTQIIDDVLALFPREMVNYHEPFLGGGSVLLALLDHKKRGAIKVSGTIYASDLNPNLINLYKTLQTNVEELITEVGKFATAYESAKTEDEREAYYYAIRTKFNNTVGPGRKLPRAAAMLLFLNKTGFRGMYREGPHGLNIPFGHYAKPGIADADHLRAVSALLQGVVFNRAGFRDSMAQVTRGDFMYLDPPYAPEDAKSFVGYTLDGFKEDDHKQLFALCHEKTTMGAKMLLSNADVALVKDAFKSPQYTTKIISCRRAINSKNPGKRANEVLISVA